MQKQITTWLAISMFVLVLVFATVAACRRSSKSEIPGEPAVSFCDLVRRPEDYNSRTVRVYGTLIGYHELALYDSDCDPDVKFILVNFDPLTRRKLVDAISALGGAGMQRGNVWADVVIEGRFEIMPSTDCQKNSLDSGMPGRRYINYCYRIIVSDVAQVTEVPASVKWPQ